eukprot:6922860-Pyramimonas_sp.AAC.1
MQDQQMFNESDFLDRNRRPTRRPQRPTRVLVGPSWGHPGRLESAMATRAILDTIFETSLTEELT